MTRSDLWPLVNVRNATIIASQRLRGTLLWFGTKRATLETERGFREASIADLERAS